MGVTRVKKSKKKSESADDAVETLYKTVETLNLKDAEIATATRNNESGGKGSAPPSIISSISSFSSPLPSSPSSSMTPSPAIPQSKFGAEHITTPTDYEHIEQFEPPIEVHSTPNKGLAVFATRKIPAGSLVLAERPLIRLTQAEENTDKSHARSTRGHEESDNHETDDEDSPLKIQFRSLSKPTQKSYLKLYDSEKSSFSHIKSIYYSNCYNLSPSPTFLPSASKQHHHDTNPNESTLTTTTTTKGGSCIGLTASRLNHSCIPNVQFSFSEPHNLMLFHAIRPIPRGREILSTYDTVFAVRVQRRKSHLMYYGFECDCEACVPTSAFWEKSDERRRGMVQAKKRVVACEREYNDVSAGGGEEVVEEREKERMRICREACDTLVCLESLLVKEGLLGLSLADTYRELVVWALRMDDQVKADSWRGKEHDVSVACFGRMSPCVRRLKGLS